MKKIVIGITAPLSVVLIKGQLKYFVDKGYDVYLMAPGDDVVKEFCLNEGCKLLEVTIEREISFFMDLKSLYIIIRHLKRVQPDVINVGTPKMGLLGMIGAWLTNVENRVFTCRGFRYEHEQGIKKKLLMFLDRIVSRLAHTIVCISPSVKERGIIDKIFKASKTVVIGVGSSNGVDLESFNPAHIDQQKHNLLKKQLQLENKFVFGFVGRIVDRKGVYELYNAFDQIYHNDNTTHLIVVGRINIEQVSDLTLLEKMKVHPGITLTGFTFEVPLYISLFDLFVLPAWWEGFGNTLIQAAAMGLPVISTTGTGCRDAVKDGFNGTLIAPKSTEQLHFQMLRYQNDASLRLEHGKNGIEWAKRFDSKTIWKGLEKIYNSKVVYQ